MALLGLRTIIFEAPDMARASAWYERLTGVAPHFNPCFAPPPV